MIFKFNSTYIKKYQIHFIIGGICLALGFISGMAYEKLFWSESLVKNIYNTILQRQQAMRESSKQDDKIIDKQFNEIVKSFEDKPRLQRENSQSSKEWFNHAPRLFDDKQDK